MKEREERYWESFKRMYNKLIKEQVTKEDKTKILQMLELYEKEFRDEEKLKKIIIELTSWDTSIKCYKEKVEEVTQKELDKTNSFGKRRRFLTQKESIFILKEVIPFMLYNKITTGRDLFLNLSCKFRVAERVTKDGTFNRLMLGATIRSDFSEESVKNAKRISNVRGKECFGANSDTRKRVIENFDGVCFKCGSDKDLCIDHHIPCKLGGVKSITNAVILCRSCNLKKHAKHPREFYSEKELEILYTKYGVITK